MVSRVMFKIQIKTLSNAYLQIDSVACIDDNSQKKFECYIVKIRFQWLNRFPYGPRQDGLKWAAIFKKSVLP